MFLILVLLFYGFSMGFYKGRISPNTLPIGLILKSGTELNAVFRFVLFCFSFCLVFGGPGGGFGDPGGGFLLGSLSSDFATTFTNITAAGGGRSGVAYFFI